MGRPIKFTDEQMVAALAECKGMVYLAARRVGCSPDAIHKRARKSAAVRDAIRTHRGEVVDAAELKLYAAVMDGEPWAIQLCLKTLGRDRGYSERPAAPEGGYVLEIVTEIVEAPAPPRDGAGS